MGTIANKIRARMTDKGLRQIDLVRKTGASKKIVSGWVKHGKYPSARHAPRVASVLELSILEITPPRERPRLLAFKRELLEQRAA